MSETDNHTVPFEKAARSTLDNHLKELEKSVGSHIDVHIEDVGKGAERSLLKPEPTQT
jgi:predicted thioesterase